MKHSVFKQITAVFFAAIIFASAAAGVCSFIYNSGMVVSRSSQYARAGAMSAARVLEGLDFDKLKESSDSELYINTCEVLKTICESLELEYLYVYEADEENNAATFIMTVTSDDKRDTDLNRIRGLGVTVPRQFTEQERMALSGEEHPSPYIERNAFGNVYSWFYPVYDKNHNVAAIIGSDYSAGALLIRIIKTTLMVIAFMVGVLVLVLIIVMIAMRKRIFDPIKLISNRMKDFITDSGTRSEPLNIKSHDEIGEIAGSFEKMSDDINKYLGSIERLTAERVQAKVELEIATRIQRGIVPESAEMKSAGYEICAAAKPAREVGGDFYDCFKRNDGGVCVVIGDVSGKGVAAAMFMVMTKTMLRDLLNSDLSPAEALNAVNDALCGSNPEGMFVTVFAAVLDPSRGVIRYANAGHTRPVIFGSGADFLDTDSGIALGLFENAGIVDFTAELKRDTGILIYTDGVTEAVNTRREFFGEKRLLSAVSDIRGARSCVDAIRDAVVLFSGGEEQFDDNTVLALYYSGGSEHILYLKPELSSLTELKREILKMADSKKVYLACEEVFVNIVNYSGASAAKVSFEKNGGILTVEFLDDGMEFNPLDARGPDGDFDDLDNGGMGINLVKQLSYGMKYKRENGRNILTLEFALTE